MALRVQRQGQGYDHKQLFNKIMNVSLIRSLQRYELNSKRPILQQYLTKLYSRQFNMSY